MPFWRRLIAEPADTRMRAAFEIHDGLRSTPVFADSTLPILRGIRSKYRRAGCSANIVTMLRAPVVQTVSIFAYWGVGAIPYCAWEPVSDIQSRLLLGVEYKKNRRVSGDSFKPSNTSLLAARWSESVKAAIANRTVHSLLPSFDVVGLNERFKESIVAMQNCIHSLGQLAFRNSNIRYGSTAAQPSDAALASRGRRRWRRWKLRRKREPKSNTSPRDLVKSRVEQVLAQQSKRKMHVQYSGANMAKRRLALQCSNWGCHPEQYKQLFDGKNPVAADELCDVKPISSDGFVQRVEESIQLDSSLYDTAARLFAEQSAKFGVDRAEVNALEQRNAAHPSNMERRRRSNVQCTRSFSPCWRTCCVNRQTMQEWCLQSECPRWRDARAADAMVHECFANPLDCSRKL